MSEQEQRITWRWVAGVIGLLLFAVAAAWAARVDSAIAEVQGLKASVGYIQRDIEEIKDIMKELSGRK